MNPDTKQTTAEATARRYHIGNGLHCFYILKDGKYALKSFGDGEEAQEITKAAMSNLNESPLLEAIAEAARKLIKGHAETDNGFVLSASRSSLSEALSALADCRKGKG